MAIVMKIASTGTVKPRNWVPLEAEIGEGDADGHALGKAVDGQDAEDEDELLKLASSYRLGSMSVSISTS